MKKIKNPYLHLEGYNCFGCAPENPLGVKMEFYEDGDDIVSIWSPRSEYQGWLNTLHGGIQSVLLDEICAWVVMRKKQTAGVTSKMETRFCVRSAPTGATLRCVRTWLRSGATFCSLMRNFTMRRGSCVRSAAARTLHFRKKRRKRIFISWRAS